MTLELARKRRNQSDLIDELVAELGAMVDWLVYWEAKPKNLAYTAIVAPKIAAARAVLEKAKQLDEVQQ